MVMVARTGGVWVAISSWRELACLSACRRPPEHEPKGGSAVPKWLCAPVCWMIAVTWLVPLSVGAQYVFEQTFGGVDKDEGYSAVETSDGGFIVAGRTFSFGAGESDVYLIRTDAAGETTWTRTYGGEEVEYAYSVEETDDGGYIAAGWTSSYGAGRDDIYLIRTDSAGDTLWTRAYGGPDPDLGFSVRQTADRGYVVAGGTRSLGAGSWDVILIKADSIGDAVWVQTYGDTDPDLGFSVRETADGGYIIAGRSRSYGAGGDDVYLIRTDDAGDTVWTRTYGGPDDDEGYSVDETADGGYIVVGKTRSFGGGPCNVYLIKTDGVGDTVWTRTYGGRAVDWGSGVEQTTDGGYVVVGRTYEFGAGGSDVYLVKTDDAGDTVWTRTFGGPEDDWGYSVAQTADSGYVIAGWTESFGAGDFDVYLIKTEPEDTVQVSEGHDVLHPRRRWSLSQNRPNPFRATTTISYALPDRQQISLTIYDISGARVRTLVSRTLPAGLHNVVWDGRDEAGHRVANGVYFYCLRAGGHAETRRMALIR